MEARGRKISYDPTSHLHLPNKKIEKTNKTDCSSVTIHRKRDPEKGEERGKESEKTTCVFRYLME